MVNYRDFYHTEFERYVFETVGANFRRGAPLSTFDFFCILVWKSNRTRSTMMEKIARLGKEKGYNDLEATVRALLTDLAEKRSPRDRMQFLCEEWNIPLPTASAILCVFYPDEFTVYDFRVCNALNGSRRFQNLADKRSFDKLWSGYEEYAEAVKECPECPPDWSLREKDQYLWGKSKYNDLMNAEAEVKKRIVAPR